jgi:hypothetical protein
MCVAIIGAIVSAAGSAIGIAQQAAMYRQQAALHERQSILERQAGQYRAARETERVQAMIGQGAAGAASSGLRMTGTTGQAITDIGTSGALDVAATRWNARLASDNERILAANARQNASNTMMGLPFAVVTPFINMASQNPQMFTSSGGPMAGRGTTLASANPFYRPTFAGAVV